VETPSPRTADFVVRSSHRYAIIKANVGLVTVSGEPGSRHEEVARLAAKLTGFELVTDARVRGGIAAEFPAGDVPADARPHLATSMLARLATEHHLILSCEGAERLFPGLAGVLRVRVVAPESYRVGALMVDRNLDREHAKELLRELEREQRGPRGAKAFDLVLNAERLTTDQMAGVLAQAVSALGIREHGLLPFAVESQLQFEARLNLAGHGIAPPGEITVQRRDFSHPSEEVFANLLDFYRIAWEYEPRSFPIEWDSEGRVIEAFTPDFYLPDFDTFVELTTMRQSLVTRKNRKIKKLKSLYPGIRIQIFYQKDFENLIFKHGLAQPAAAP
jgi:hypothetical protein